MIEFLLLIPTGGRARQSYMEARPLYKDQAVRLTLRASGQLSFGSGGF